MKTQHTNTQKPIVITNPVKICADRGRITIKEHIIQEDKDTISRHWPDQVESIIILSKKSSVTGEALDLLKDKEVVYAHGKPQHILVPTCKLPRGVEIDKKLAALPKSRINKIAYVFCKGVCLGRIREISRLNEKRKDEELARRIKQMRSLERGLISCKTPAEMKTIEGNLTKHFYASIQHMLGGRHAFTGRDKNAGDLYNVLLNASHGVLRARITKMLQYNGLNTGYGFLHNQEGRNHHFMAWDFAELWIPYVDKLCFYGIDRGIFTEKSLIKAGRGKNPHWLSKHGWGRLYELMDRVGVDDMQQKIGEFKEHVLMKKRFSWKLP